MGNATDRIITVKGVGEVSAKPDIIVLSLMQKTEAREYAKTMEKAAAELEQIRQAISAAGYDSAKLKTSRFNINTHYERKQDTKGNYKSYFKGYVCSHELHFEFLYDMKELGKVLSAIADCGANPEFSIRFSVKDVNAFKEQILKNAVANAASRAKLLAQSAGVKLGEILRIDYSWGEIEFHSETRYELDFECSAPMSIEPEDVKASDTVTVIWAIS